MTFKEVAWNNMRRNPVRSILTGLSLAVSAATLVIVLGLDQGYTSAVTTDLVDKTGVHMYITKEGCPIEAASVIAQGGLSPLYVKEDLVPILSQHPNVETVLPFQLFTSTTEDGTRTDIFMGITEAIMKIRPDWQFKTGGWFQKDDSIILGAEIARIERLSVGETTYSDVFDREFIVTGILERNYSQDDGTLYIPLKTAQEMVSRQGKLSAIAIKTNDINAFDITRNEIRASIPEEYYVVGARELSEGILTFFASTRIIMFVMVIVALLISVFGVVNTMLMAVIERRREIAYLRCVGAGKKDILRLITLEAFAISLTGSVIGVIVGLSISPAFGNFMRSFLVAYIPSGSIVKPDLGITLLALIGCTLIGVICSLYPALRASKIVPMEVLRND
ncbi:FtsX-like permease family protein [bacterium]|nr:FtsX-like permease family protein [bacterium]